jgi:chloramphenicol-sensitive protein RarD
VSVKQQRDGAAGLAYGVACYFLWGVLPLYWNLLRAVPSFEIIVHRMLWCAITMGIVVAALGKWSVAMRALRTPRIVLTLLGSAFFITANWGIYIWCVESRQLVEASLGYFINPLVVLVMGVFLLGESMSPLRWLAVVLGVAAVAIQTYALARFPWLAFTLGVSFAFYGYLRKTVAVGALEGLFLESALCLPITIGLVGYWAAKGTGAFGAADLHIDGLLILAGPITATPLAFFAAAAQRLRFSTVGFLQYLAPIIALYIAIFLFGERVTWIHVFTFGCVWAALIALALDGAPRHWRNPARWLRRKSPEAMGLPIE